MWPGSTGTGAVSVHLRLKSRFSMLLRVLLLSLSDSGNVASYSDGWDQVRRAERNGVSMPRLGTPYCT